MKRLKTFWSTVLCVALLAGPLLACSVPVFRYALERWPSDNYELIVFHRGGLPDEHKPILTALGEEDAGARNYANVKLIQVDLDDNPLTEYVELFESQKDAQLPWMVVRYPKTVRRPMDVWSGPLSESAIRSVLDSPLRQEISQKLLDGQTAVWVLLEAGDKEKDDAAYKLLQEELAKLEMTLKLPEVSEQDIAEGLVSIDPDKLQISFSVARLSRKNSEEKMLIEMLLASEDWSDSVPTLRTVEKPMVFPIFGRGRALYGLMGAGINPDTIAAAGTDLTGPCTCTVKDQNPGIDLVMSVDWDNLIEDQLQDDQAIPQLASLGGFNPDAEITTETQTLPKEAPAEEPAGPPKVTPADPAEVSSSPSMLKRNVLAVAALVVVFVLAATVLLFRKGG